MNDSKIEKIRASCSIAWAWRILDLPGKPGRSCISPFRQEDKPSFSVYMGKDCERWFDHGTGMKGDVVDFWALAKDITVQRAIDELMRLTGSAEAPKTGTYKVVKEEKPIQWPDDLRSATLDECYGLGLLRSLSYEAFNLANELGTLKVGTDPVRQELLWYITDAKGMGAEGRTFTGEPCLASGKKAAFLPEGKKSWPYGLFTIRKEWNAILNLVLVEGAPDYFAGLQMALGSKMNFRPIAMLGASTSIGEDARYWISGHRVLIIPHSDEDGKRSVERWTRNLYELGALKVLLQRLPPEVKDLNDFASLYPERLNDLLKGLDARHQNEP